VILSKKNFVCVNAPRASIDTYITVYSSVRKSIAFGFVRVNVFNLRSFKKKNINKIGV